MEGQWTYGAGSCTLLRHVVFEMPAIAPLDPVNVVYETFNYCHWTLPRMGALELGRFPSPFPLCRLLIEAACSLFRALLPKGRHPHAALRERKLSTLHMWSCCSYPTSFSNTTARISGFRDNLGSHMLCFCSFWSLCPRCFISLTPSSPL